jgi:D-lactate dehydrogenase
LAHRYGKDTLWLIDRLGTERLPAFFALKRATDVYLKRIPFLPKNVCDRLLQAFSRFLPEALPRRFLEFRASFEHHLILPVTKDSTPRTERLLDDLLGPHEWFVCSPKEAKKVMLHRIVAAVRYTAVNTEVADQVLALDIALRRDDVDWFE